MFVTKNLVMYMINPFYIVISPSNPDMDRGFPPTVNWLAYEPDRT